MYQVLQCFRNTWCGWKRQQLHKTFHQINYMWWSFHVPPQHVHQPQELLCGPGGNLIGMPRTTGIETNICLCFYLKYIDWRKIGNRLTRFVVLRRKRKQMTQKINRNCNFDTQAFNMYLSPATRIGFHAWYSSTNVVTPADRQTRLKNRHRDANGSRFFSVNQQVAGIALPADAVRFSVLRRQRKQNATCNFLTNHEDILTRRPLGRRYNMLIASSREACIVRCSINRNSSYFSFVFRLEVLETQGVVFRISQSQARTRFPQRRVHVPVIIWQRIAVKRRISAQPKQEERQGEWIDTAGAFSHRTSGMINVVYVRNAAPRNRRCWCAIPAFIETKETAVGFDAKKQPLLNKNNNMELLSLAVIVRQKINVSG